MEGAGGIASTLADDAAVLLGLVRVDGKGKEKGNHGDTALC